MQDYSSSNRYASTLSWTLDFLHMIPFYTPGLYLLFHGVIYSVRSKIKA